MQARGRSTPHLEHFEEQLQQWTDERIVSRGDISVWYMFNEYLVNLSEEDGWEYTGHSLTKGLPMSRLVVRGRIDGIHHVVFSSGRTPTGCMRAFLRKMKEGWLEWQVDRYRS